MFFLVKGAVITRMLALVVSAKLCFLDAWAEGSGRDGALQFNREVRPILADHCYACHGPNEHSPKAKLRLDQKESALGTHQEGAAIVPGKPATSTGTSTGMDK